MENLSHIGAEVNQYFGLWIFRQHLVRGQVSHVNKFMKIFNNFKMRHLPPITLAPAVIF